MAFIDEAQFNIKAGNGGHGVVRWRHEKGKEFSGPSGGDGGKGADIYVRAVRDVGILGRYRHVKEFVGEHGQDGMRNSMHGSDGKDLIIDLPIGAIVTNTTTGKTFSLLTEGETVFILKGGRGGMGNEQFRSSVNIRPVESTKGKPGEEGDFSLELELVVDAGLIGIPNAGKSSLLNELTNASSKVGSYQFTTLEPHLGALSGGFVLADIPGLIEGASEGKGLGHAFLRHIKRTKMILHCLSLENTALVETYKIIRKELTEYDPALAEKKEVVILTKTDLVTEKELATAIKKIEKYNKDIFTVTVYDDVSVKKLNDKLVKILRAL